MNELLCICPAFPPEGQVSDGQALFIVSTVRAMARETGRRLRVLCLRFGAQVAHEEHEACSVERVRPAVDVADVFALTGADAFPRAFESLTARALELVRAEPGLQIWIHGYECGFTASRLREAGASVVSTLHYSAADETVHLLSSDAPGLPRGVAPLAHVVPAGVRHLAVRAASRLSALPRRWPGRGSLPRLQLDKLESERRLLAASSVVLAYGPTFARSVARLYPEYAERIRGCLPGTIPSADTGERGHPGPRRQLLLVGRPTPQKGWDLLARALEQLERNHPELARGLELRVIGGLGGWKGAQAAFGEAVLRQLQALRHVKLRNDGRLSHREVLQAYAEADVFVFPSLYEPFGLVLLEAMGAGCPVLASNADGPREAVGPSSGWLVPFEAPAERVTRLCEALVSVARAEAATLREMGRAARAATGRFDWSETARAHLAALADAANEDRLRRASV